MKQFVRIIGGQFRGKKISFPAIDGLRPTPDRVRETLFNWLMHDIHHARCLDAFAGSGALGFEAFSRGADQVVFLEQSLPVYLHLKKQIDAFKAANLTAIHTDTLDYVTQQAIMPPHPFDIIFMDPPFAKPELFDCISTLAETNLLTQGGLLYLESPQEITLDAHHWTTLKIKRAGQVFYGLYRKDSKEASLKFHDAP